jgi:hypothetical protein
VGSRQCLVNKVDSRPGASKGHTNARSSENARCEKGGPRGRKGGAPFFGRMWSSESECAMKTWRKCCAVWTAPSELGRRGIY